MSEPIVVPRPILPRVGWQPATVTAVTDETPRTRTLALAIPTWPGHRPGQHLDVRRTAPDGYQASRSYSIASAPESSTVALTVERLPDGEVSPYLTEIVQPGDRFEVRGPIGGYFTWTVSDGGPLYLVAGGSGVVPLMAMLRHRANQHSAIPATLLYSTRGPEDTIFAAELRSLAADPGFRLVQTFTRSQPADWIGSRRRIDRELLAATFSIPAPGARAYVCGPTALVEQVATDLVALGLAPADVRTERFGASGGVQ